METTTHTVHDFLTNAQRLYEGDDVAVPGMTAYNPRPDSFCLRAETEAGSVTMVASKQGARERHAKIIWVNKYNMTIEATYVKTWLVNRVFGMRADRLNRRYLMQSALTPVVEWVESR